MLIACSWLAGSHIGCVRTVLATMPPGVHSKHFALILHKSAFVSNVHSAVREAATPIGQCWKRYLREFYRCPEPERGAALSPTH